MTKTLLQKLQVKQNRIVKIISYKIKNKQTNKLKPLYEKFKFLNVEGVVSKLKTAKFMIKLNNNKVFTMTKRSTETSRAVAHQ